MRALALSLACLLAVPALGGAAVREDRPINIITSNYDLVDTTYIDRGRLDGVKIGDRFQVRFRDGKLATVVVVTGVFDRMASVKIADDWLLKNGQLANFKQRPMVVTLEPSDRVDADLAKRHRKRHGKDQKMAAQAAPAPAATTPTAAAPAASAPAPQATAPAPSDAAALPPLPSDAAGAAAAPAAPDAGLPPLPADGAKAGAGDNGAVPPVPE